MSATGFRPRPPQASARSAHTSTTAAEPADSSAAAAVRDALEQSRRCEAAGSVTDAAHAATTALVRWRALPPQARHTLLNGTASYERSVADLVGRCNAWAVTAMARRSQLAATECGHAALSSVGDGATSDATFSEEAEFLLTRALTLTGDPGSGGLFMEADDADRLRLRAVSHNNMGCLERARGSYEAALAHLERAVEIETALDPACGALPATHLNLSTVLGLMGRAAASLAAARRGASAAASRLAAASAQPDGAQHDGARLTLLAADVAVAAAHEAVGTDADVEAACRGFRRVVDTAAAMTVASTDPAFVSLVRQADVSLQRIVVNRGKKVIEIAATGRPSIMAPRPPSPPNGAWNSVREQPPSPVEPSHAASEPAASPAADMLFVARPPQGSTDKRRGGPSQTATGAGAAVLFLRRPSSALIKGAAAEGSIAPFSPVPPPPTQSLSARRVPTVTARHASALAAHQERLAARTARAVELEHHARDLARRAGQSREAARVRREQAALVAAREAVAEHQFRALQSAARAAQTQTRRIAATEIQRTWRGFAVRRQLDDIADASVRIQSTFRAFTVRATQPAPARARLTRRAAAICIQRAMRRVLFVLELERRAIASVLRRHYTARRIQAAWRAYIVRSEAEFHAQIASDMAAARLRTHRAATVQAAAWARLTNSLVAALVHRRRGRDTAAARIQARVRGIQARFRTRVLVALRAARRAELLSERQAAVLQRVGRALAARKALHRTGIAKVYSIRSAAATRIAAPWRGSIARRAYRVARDVRRQERAAIAAAQAVEAQRHAAAAAIQHAHRSRVVREDYKLRRQIAAQASAAEAQRLKRTGHAMCIQTFALSALTRPVFGRALAQFQCRTAAATLLQSAARAMRCRRDMAATRRVAMLIDRRARERQVLQGSATCIQSFLRAAASGSLVASTALRHAAVPVVRAHLHAAVSREIVAALNRVATLAAFEAAALRIQTTARRWQQWRHQEATAAYYAEQRRVRMVAARNIEAATQIQAVWRGFCARDRVRGIRQLMAQELRAALRLQRTFRMVLDVVSMHHDAATRAVEAQRRERAALRIQCMWRRVLATDYAEMLRERRFVRHAAAICIQCTWRRLLAQRQLHGLRERRAEARKQAAARLEVCTHACSLVSRLWLARCAGWERVKRHEAALIAAVSFNARVERQRLARAATRIAATYRGHYERAYARGLRRERDARLRAAADLQARRVAAAATIQRGYRCYCARAQLAILREHQRAAAAAERLAQDERADPAAAVREIFWAFRAASAASASPAEQIVQARRREAASRVLHRVARSYLARLALAADMRRARAAARAAARAVAIQAAAVAREKRRGDAAARIQHALRGFMVRCAYLTQRDEAVALRAAALADAERCDQAATKIQALRRGVIARRSSSALRAEEERQRATRRENEAATLIQRAYRSASRASTSRCGSVVTCGRTSSVAVAPQAAAAAATRPPLVPRPPSARTGPASSAAPPTAPRSRRPLSASSVVSSIPVLAESSEDACYGSSPTSATPQKQRDAHTLISGDVLIPEPACTSASEQQHQHQQQQQQQQQQQRLALAAMSVAASIDSALLIAVANAALPTVTSLSELQDPSVFASRPASRPRAASTPDVSPPESAAPIHVSAVVRLVITAALAVRHSLPLDAVAPLTEYDVLL